MTMINKNKKQIQLMLLLGMCVVYITASVIPDASFVELDHDLHDVRDERLKRDTKEKIKVTKITRNEMEPDDFDLAAQEIFDHVENAEKTVLTAAGDFIKNEAEFLSLFVSTGHKDAAKDLFDHIESVEHQAIFAVGDFIKNEVDFFFANHNMGQADEEIHQCGGRRGANLRKKRNMERFDMESKHDRVVNIINDYIESDME